MQPEISKKLASFKRNPSPVREIMSFANPATFAKYGYKPDQIISFAGGWVNHPAPEELREAYLEVINDPTLFHKSGAYPPTIGTPESREAIVTFGKHIYNYTDLTADNIAVGNNSTQLTFNLFNVLLDPGDKILLLDPSYCNLQAQIVTATEAKIIRFKVLDRNSYLYQADQKIKEFQDFIYQEKPKVIFLISPDNPTSQVLSDRFMEETLDTAKKVGAFVVVDFAYKEIVFKGKYPKYFSWSPSHNFITLHSNSKWCRGLGRRLGWIQGPKDVIGAIEAIQGSSMLCPDMLHSMAFIKYLDKALKNNSLKPYLEKMINLYEKAAKATIKAIKTHLGIPYLTPQGGLYTTIKVGIDGAAFTQMAIENEGILLVPGWGFGRSLIDSVRICYGPLVHDHNLIEKGLEKLASVLNKLERGRLLNARSHNVSINSRQKTLISK